MKKLPLVIVGLLLVSGCVREPRRHAPGDARTDATVREAGAGEPDPVPAGGWKYEAQLQRALKFLLETQNANGSWGSPLPERPGDIYTGGTNSFHAFGNASSALCCMALLAQPSDAGVDTAMLKGYRYLVDAPDAVRVSGDTFYNVWAQAYMLEALSRGLMDKRLEKIWPEMRKRAEFEMTRLFKIQSLDGGFGYYDFGWVLAHPTGEISTTMSATAALVGLRAAKDAGLEIPAKELKCALEYLDRMRLPNGAYLYSTDHTYYPVNRACGIRGSLGRSQGGNCALAEWGKSVTPELIEKGFKNFVDQHMFIEIGRCRQYPHEAWYATAPYYYYFGHYYASRNLAQLKPELQQHYAHWLADTVALTQFDDGSFWDYPLFGYTKSYGTGYGVLILSNCRKMIRSVSP